MNLCGDVGSLAAQAAMYTDILITEEAILFRKNFGRLTHDEVKFFNAIQRAAIDAIEEARGVPESARASLQASLHALQVRVDTRWGMLDPIPTQRCALQGLGCALEASKLGQDTKLRLRSRSPFLYTSLYGRSVTGTAYVDDGRHYTDGASSLLQANKELAAGSRFSGNAAHPRKSSAFATDWDSYASSPQGIEEGFTVAGVSVPTYDIHSGTESLDSIPRVQVDSPDVFLCKGGTISDRHSDPAAKLIANLSNVIETLRWKHACWDEIALALQWKGRGLINYCPLACIPVSL